MHVHGSVEHSSPNKLDQTSGRNLAPYQRPQLPTHHFGRYSGSYDSPLGSYASLRSRSQLLRLASSSIYPRSSRKYLGDCSLSELCAQERNLASVGAAFNSTTKVKCVPLPFMCSHLNTSRNVRKVLVHTRRYTPAPIPALHTAASVLAARSWCVPKRSPQDRLKFPLLRRKHEIAVNKDGNFKLIKVIPHRLNKGFYMNSQRIPLYDREALPSRKALALENSDPMLYKPPPFYETGIRLQRKVLHRFGTEGKS